MASESISKKKERAALVEKANGAEFIGALTWEGFDKFKVKYSLGWQTGDYSYRIGTIEVKLKKSEKWIPYSYHSISHGGLWLLKPRKQPINVIGCFRSTNRQ
jgi:hypothetical protein